MCILFLFWTLLCFTFQWRKDDSASCGWASSSPLKGPQSMSTANTCLTEHKQQKTGWVCLVVVRSRGGLGGRGSKSSWPLVLASRPTQACGEATVEHSKSLEQRMATTSGKKRLTHCLFVLQISEAINWIHTLVVASQLNVSHQYEARAQNMVSHQFPSSRAAHGESHRRFAFLACELFCSSAANHWHGWPSSGTRKTTRFVQ